ncbi:hypothetical protein EDC01DRAFT_609113 [Geopyxis carbonaria]|nr:hypothetical protein EDC01DRAFT_609113 [Geopyxis carbonaria]
MENGAPGHKKHAIEYRKLNEIDVLPWPAQSPDLNLIEAFCMDMQTELGETWGRVADIKVMKVCLTTVWKMIEEDRMKSLIGSMPARLQAVIDAGGSATPY